MTTTKLKLDTCLAVIAISLLILYVPKKIEETHLDRVEAISLLKELIAVNLVEPSFVHVLQRTPNHYQIQIKSNYKSEIEEYAKQFGLTIEEDETKQYLLIFKP